MKKIKLLIDVTNVLSAGNLAEDAHNTVINVTIPPSLQFASVIPKVTEPDIKGCPQAYSNTDDAVNVLINSGVFSEFKYIIMGM